MYKVDNNHWLDLKQSIHWLRSRPFHRQLPQSQNYLHRTTYDRCAPISQLKNVHIHSDSTKTKTTAHIEKKKTLSSDRLQSTFFQANPTATTWFRIPISPIDYPHCAGIRRIRRSRGWTKKKRHEMNSANESGWFSDIPFTTTVASSSDSSISSPIPHRSKRICFILDFFGILRGAQKRPILASLQRNFIDP